MKVIKKKIGVLISLICLGVACGTQSQTNQPSQVNLPFSTDKGLFQSQNTYMRSLQRDDFQTLKAIMSDPVNQNMSGDVLDDATIYRLVQATPFINGNRSWNFLGFAIISKENDSFIGMLQLYRAHLLPTFQQFLGFSFQFEDDDHSIGYSLEKAYWGKGLMSEVVKALIDFDTQKFRPRRFFAETLTSNKGSQRVLVKNGFKQLGEQVIFSTSLGKSESHTYFNR
jgi:RimJ/RimL family protein N-acetyltransferase